MRRSAAPAATAPPALPAAEAEEGPSSVRGWRCSVCTPARVHAFTLPLAQALRTTIAPLPSTAFSTPPQPASAPYLSTPSFHPSWRPRCNMLGSFLHTRTYWIGSEYEMAN